MATRYAQTGATPSPATGGASELATTGSPVVVNGAAPPSTGKLLTATSSTAADWENPAAAAKLATTGADVVINTASPPSTGQSLVATSATAATWQTPAAGAATQLATTGASVVINGAAPPTTGQVLTATSATAANWQTPSGGSPNVTIPIRNSSGGSITQGQAVYISGAFSAGHPQVSLARANAVGTSVFIGAVVDASISNGGDGTAQSSGVFSVPAALQVGTWTAGDRIYLATTVAGKYTNAVTVTVGEVLVPIGRSLDTPAGGAANVLIILESLEVII